MIEFDTLDTKASGPHIAIKVIGVGGAGGNMINNMAMNDYSNIEYIAVNTDSQALKTSKAHHKIQLGAKSTKGMGSGANPDLGRRAAEEDIDKVFDIIQDAQVVFLAAGMGGGTGSGSLPVIARALKDKNVLLIAVVTTPFAFEGKRRMRVAQEAIKQLKDSVDTLIMIPNQRLLDLADASVSMVKAFDMVNDVLWRLIKSVYDIIEKPGHINVDFADVRSIMKETGIAVMGTGSASGLQRASEAAMLAISSPLLENMSIAGASGVLLHVAGPSNMGIHEISTAASIVHEQVHEDASIILGSSIDDSLQDTMIVTVIATGFASQVRDNSELNIRATTMDRARAQSSVAAEQHVAGQHVETHSVGGQHAAHQSVEEHAVPQPINMDDLEVPTFMRRSVLNKMLE